MTLLDYPGKVACTVFLPGCNFRCPFCHNFELLGSQAPTLMDDQALLAFLKKRTGLLDGVCITGGEPTLQPGLPALLAYMTFLVWCLVRHIRAYRLSTVPQRRGLAVCLAIVVYVLINNLFETNMVLMSTNPIQAIFWFTAGVDMALCRRIIRQRKEEPT